MTMTQGIELGLLILTAGCGGIIWIVGAMISPMRKEMATLSRQIESVVENSTRTTDRFIMLMDRHDERINDHDKRLVKLETKHEH